MLFVPCSVDRQCNPLALVPKKSVALQWRRQPSAGVAPVSGESGTSVTASSAGRMLPMVAPVPLAGWADTGAQRAPSEVREQPAMAAIPLPTMGQTGLPFALVAPTMVGATLSVVTPPNTGGGGSSHDRRVMTRRNLSDA